MKVVHYEDIPGKYMDGGPVKDLTGRVLIGKQDGADHFCMRSFVIGPGGYTPLHTHDWEHEIFCHQGNGAIYREGEWVPFTAGCCAFVPGGELHQMKNTGTTPLVVVCLIPAGPPEL
ncbi:MAG: cupin domain-containing protein [Thermodesulfobacteriota bacterium]